MKNIRFIINPKSGVKRNKDLTAYIDEIFDKQHFNCEIVYTSHPHHGIALAQEAVADKVDVIVAVGGDGSVNDVVNGMAGSEVTLGIVPLGSGNGLARSLEIPLDEAKALKIIKDGLELSIDVGKANEYYFASNVGVGFDTVISNAFASLDNRGFASYVHLVWDHLTSFTPEKWEIEIKGEVMQTEAFMISVANAYQLGYSFTIAPEASIVDGLLNVVIIKPFPLIFAPIIGSLAFLRNIDKSHNVETKITDKIIIRKPGKHLFQTDAEVHEFEDTLHIEVLPKFMKVLVKK